MDKIKKFSWNEIIKSLEARWFMASMATGAMGIFTFLIFGATKIILLKFLSLFLIALAFFIFIISSVFTFIRWKKFPEAIKADIYHPIASHFFAGISIASAILSTSVSNILIPLKIFSPEIGGTIALVLYGLAVLLGVSFLLMTNIALITSEDAKPNHALGIWLLPPVGIFVSIFAGNFVAQYFISSIGSAILLFNIFLFGIAFFYYFYTMTMIFHRIKFYALPPSAMAPSFLIPLAPVGVSIIALFSFQKVLGLFPQLSEFLQVFHSFFLLYTPMIIGFGFFWAVSTFLIIAHYIRTKGLPFSLGFWAFVFPVDAFGIALFLSSTVPIFSFLRPVSFIVWGISFVLWIFVFYKTISSLKTGKAFARPKSLEKK